MGKKNKKSKEFYITTAIAVLALIISIVSAITNEIRYEKNESERLFISFNRYFGEYPISFTSDYSGLYHSGIINTVWELTISNIGKQPVSILKYDIWSIVDNNPVQYSHLRQGIFDTDMREITLPLNLNPGESKKLFVKIGLSLKENAAEILKTAPLNEISGIMDLSKFLAGAAKIDIFDNNVEPYWDLNKEKVIGFQVTSQVNDQEIYIELISSKNKLYHAESGWYDFP